MHISGFTATMWSKCDTAEEHISKHEFCSATRWPNIKAHLHKYKQVLLIITLKPTQREAGYTHTTDKTINKEI